MSEFVDSTRAHGDENIFEQQTEMKLKRDENSTPVAERVLHNPLILDVIFDHLPKWNWKSARLVNKIWHSTLQYRWREQMNYRLGLGLAYDQSLLKHGQFTAEFMEEQHPINNPSDPLELGRHPIRNICARWGKDNKYTLFQANHTQFWKMYGHGLKSINFYGVRIHRAASFKRVMLELTPSLEEFCYWNCVCEDIDKLKLNNVAEYLPPPVAVQKNLKVVKLATSLLSNNWYRNRNANDYKPRFPISWIQFFSTFPNIQKLVLDIDLENTARPSDLLKVFEAIDVIRKANNNEVLNITELLMGGIGFAHFDEIRIGSLFASLPISFLQLNLALTSNDKTALLLQTVKSTLRHLKLILNSQPHDGGANRELPKDVFPQGLTKLSLQGPLLLSFEFLMFLPNLEELEVKDIPCILPPDIDIAAVVPLVNLRKLVYTKYFSFPFPLHRMDVVAELMSSVKICDCTVDAIGFRALCRGLVNLEKLVAFLEFRSEDFFVNDLIRFTCLRSLEIEDCRFCITDKSVFDAFLRIPSLEKITLSSFVEKEISEVGLQALEDKLSICD